MIKVAHVSTFPPLRCGIATFVADLMAAIPTAMHIPYELHYGTHAVRNAANHADVNSPAHLVELAKAISASDCHVVSLQHEFGIWGGQYGEHLRPFLQHLQKPLVSVLHTTFGRGLRPPIQQLTICELIDRSARVIVLTNRAKATVEGLLARPLGKLVVIPHGIHRVDYIAPPAWPVSMGSNARFQLVTPGYFREDKGLEIALLAVWRLGRKGIPVSYLIAGEPQRQFGPQKAYLAELRALVNQLGLEHVVKFDTRYLSVEEQVAAIRASHAGVFSYQEPIQSSSGTIPLVIAAGRPVVCTPFEYSKVKAAESPSVCLATNFSAWSIADGIEKLMFAADYADMARSAHRLGEGWAWPTVGAQFLAQYLAAIEEAESVRPALRTRQG